MKPAADQLVQAIIDANQQRLSMISYMPPSNQSEIAVSYLRHLIDSLAQNIPGVTDYLSVRLGIIQEDIKRIEHTTQE